LKSFFLFISFETRFVFLSVFFFFFFRTFSRAIFFVSFTARSASISSFFSDKLTKTKPPLKTKNLKNFF